MHIDKKHILFILIAVFLLPASLSLDAQTAHDSVYILPSVIIDGDTIPQQNIKEIKVFAPKKFSTKRQQRRYTRLVINVKKAYPFAVIARQEFKKMNDTLTHIKGEREQKHFMKEYEKEMLLKYEADLRKLTITQGRILLKLLDREFGNTSYELVQEYRGNFSAVFWQGIARIFGSNLKSEYDPKGEDAEIEEIVQLIEAGLL